MPTCKEQRDKIIEAYFRDEIEPFDGRFCFCGTLAGGLDNWSRDEDERCVDYSHDEFARMEKSLLVAVRKGTVGFTSDWEYEMFSMYDRDLVTKHANYESALFEGMSAALEDLKQIHIERGEKIDEGQEGFTKRQLFQNFKS